MKYAIAAAGLLLTSSAFAQSSQQLATALHQRMEQATPKDAQSALIRKAFQAFENKPCFAQFQPRIEAMIQKYSRTSGAKQFAINAYANQFTAAELQGLINFADTPLGKKFFRVQPVIAGEATQMAMQHFQQNQMAITQETMKLIEQMNQQQCNP